MSTPCLQKRMQQGFEADENRREELEGAERHGEELPGEVHPVEFLSSKEFEAVRLEGALQIRIAKAVQHFVVIPARLQCAGEAHQRYEEKLRDIEAEAREKIQEAINDARVAAGEITDKARDESTQLIESARQRVELELAGSREKLREEVVALTLNVAERLLKERLSEAKDRELVASFIDDLDEVKS